jgi:hypothetical protein
MDIDICTPSPARDTTSGRWRWLRVLLGGLLGVALWLAGPAVQPQQMDMRGYDHASTGFPLTGAHRAARCEACHTGGVLRGTPRNCDGCHLSGARLAGNNVVKPQRHLPTQQGCESCHNTRMFTGARFDHLSVRPGSCESCHNGAIATGKPRNHVATSSACDSCHRAKRSWTAGVTFAHTPANALGTGTCDTCHDGRAARGRPASHVPVTGSTARCDSCHRSQASFNAAVTMNHTVVATAGCKSCHNGAYVSQGPIGAQPKPGNHIPEQSLLNGGAMECNACHTSTTAWTAMRMNHNNSTGRGAGTCRSCHQSGTNFLGNMEREALTHESRTAVDCSDSGCHRPLGRVGSTYLRWE